jgi:hypothetical protein
MVFSLGGGTAFEVEIDSAKPFPLGETDENEEENRRSGRRSEEKLRDFAKF